MKAISLHQPWASLIAMGHKTIETRGWSTKYRGPLAIHAAKKRMSADGMELLLRNGFNAMESMLATSAKPGVGLPLGAYVATCELVDCLEITCRDTEVYLSNGEVVAADQIPFGDYRTGRFAWILKNIKRFDTPIPAKGRQRFWTWEPWDVVKV